MKTKILFLIIILISLTACNSSDGLPNAEIKNIVENITIISGQSATYSISNFLTEGSTNISKQAEHFNISAIIFGRAGIEYKYKPIDDFVGVDYVEISQLASTGDNKINQKTIFKISITVTPN
ncbi:MAG: hypothetical protein COV50_07330 [Flavobacteriales bacterium CG11_big_fil_rev_8_21_14_0_20_35_7]|nr:MAG: hypothetical protein COV50_07330 [Flavobacteriales bacterium CG11_big_fil_rev_8_21_14_0_20_35_7]PJA06981.1 MAG: hypothetical protein COX71_00595 [Flavobacteriales bacterium CG_4_10_14_0_2_um_filter_35_18]